MLLKNWRDGPKNDCANFLPNVPQLHMSTGIAKKFFLKSLIIYYFGIGSNMLRSQLPVKDFNGSVNIKKYKND
jgi:hypothetical protein